MLSTFFNLFGIVAYLGAAYAGLAMGGVVEAPYEYFGGWITGLAPLGLGIIGTKMFDWGWKFRPRDMADDVV